MRAVNLIPADERRSGSSPLREASTPTLALFGVLLVALVAVVALVVTHNQVKDRQANLASVNTQVRSVRQQAAALQPYADVAALRQRSLDTIRTLADARFDWPAVLDELSRRVPADVDLTSFTGGGSASGDSSTSSSQTTPGGTSVHLAGCTTSHTAVAHMMDQMRAVHGVTGVTLGSSTDDATGSSASAAGAGDCPHSDQFDVTLTLAGTTAASAAAAASASDTSTTTSSASPQ